LKIGLSQHKNSCRLERRYAYIYRRT